MSRRCNDESPAAPFGVAIAGSAHIVRVDKKGAFASVTLAPKPLDRLQKAFHGSRFWHRGWTDREFRAEARRVLRDVGGLILIGPGVSFEPAPPFDEFFEPIEICGTLTNRDERLKTLSGESPTTQERYGWIGMGVAYAMLGLCIVGLLTAFLTGFPRQLVIVTMILLAILTLTGFAIHLSMQWRGRVYLVPGGIAIVRRPGRRGNPPRITVFSRNDTCLVFRNVHTGKTVMLIMELWTHQRRVISRPITEREAISVIATWRGTREAIDDDRLREIAGDQTRA